MLKFGMGIPISFAIGPGINIAMTLLRGLMQGLGVAV